MARRNPEEQRMQTRFFSAWRALGPLNSMAFSIPNEGERSPVLGAQMKAAGLTAGAPDVALIVEGRFYGLEFKTPKGRMAPAQKQFGDALRRAGADHFVVRSESEAVGKAIECGVRFYQESGAKRYADQPPAITPPLPLASKPTSRRRAPLAN